MLAASSWRDQWNEMVMAQSQEQGGNNQEQTDADLSYIDQQEQYH